MTGFFAKIQSKLEAGDYAGRYLALILAEIATSNERQCFFDLLEAEGIKVKRNISDVVRTERSFTGEQQNRLADLAVDTLSGDIQVLIEIKDEDGKQKANDAQIRDYVYYIKRSHHGTTAKPKLLFISKYAPRPDDQRELDRGGNCVRQIRYGTIYKHLSQSKYKNMPISQMLRKYLEETGVTYRELQSDEAKSLPYLAQEVLGGMPSVNGFKYAKDKTTILGTAQAVERTAQECDNRLRVVIRS